MTGCLLARACLLACWLGELSQHNVTPHSWQVRRCTHCAPIFTHSAHSRRLGSLMVVMAERWLQLPLDIIHIVFKYSCTNWTAIDPSPTAEATRLTEPERTSPAANTPGRLVSSRNGCRRAVQWGDCTRAGPVWTNPLASRSTSGGSQSVRGTAPMNLT